MAVALSAGLRTWHDYARRRHPNWPPATEYAYEAAMGAVHEIAMARIATGRTGELAGLEAELLDIQLAALRVPAR